MDTQLVPKAFGLVNYSCICWFNSCMQSLLSLPSLNRYMLDHYVNCPAGKFICSYVDSIKQVLSNEQFTTLNFHNVALQLVEQAKGKHDLINSSSCANSAIVAIQELFNVEDLFRVSYEITTKCSCQYVKSSRETYQYHRWDNIIDTLAADVFLDNIRQNTTLLQDYRCDKCHQINTTTRYTELRGVRDIFIVSFHTKTMIKFYQWFPLTLDFPAANGGVLHYKLMAVIEHSGGHYWSHVVRRNGADLKWYIANDSSSFVDDIKQTDNSFILFYHKC